MSTFLLTQQGCPPPLLRLLLRPVLCPIASRFASESFCLRQPCNALRPRETSVGSPHEPEALKLALLLWQPLLRVFATSCHPRPASLIASCGKHWPRTGLSFSASSPVQSLVQFLAAGPRSQRWHSGCKRQSLAVGSGRFPCLRLRAGKSSLTPSPPGSFGSCTLRSLIWDNESHCVNMPGKSWRARAVPTFLCRLQLIWYVPCPSWRDCLPIPISKRPR